MDNLGQELQLPKSARLLTNHPRARVIWVIFGQILMAAALYLLVVKVAESGNQLLSAVGRMYLAPFIGSVLLTVFVQLMTPLGWVFALRAIGNRIPFRLAFSLCFRTGILRYLPGSFWNFPSRAILSTQHGISLSAFARSTFFELFFLLTTASVFAGWGLMLSFGLPSFWILSAAGAAAVLLAIFFPRQWLPTFVGRFLPPAPQQKESLIVLTLVYVAAWLAYGASLYLLLGALPETQPPPFWQVVSKNTAAWVGGFLSPSPGGIGVRELVFSEMFSNGLAPAATIAALTQRAIEIVVEFVLWMIARSIRA